MRTNHGPNNAHQIQRSLRGLFSFVTVCTDTVFDHYAGTDALTAERKAGVGASNQRHWKVPMAVDERSLTKGQLRKLNALKKSLGDDIGSRAFAEWMRQQPKKAEPGPRDRSAEQIAATLETLIKQQRLTFRRGGYRIRRGRGRVIVEPMEAG